MIPEVVHDLIEDTLRQIPNLTYERESKPFSASITIVKCVRFSLKSTLFREDGHSKSTNIGFVEWYPGNSDISVRGSQQRQIYKTGMGRSIYNYKIVYYDTSLASPTFLDDFKQLIQNLRKAACESQGKGGKKKNKRNQLKWS